MCAIMRTEGKTNKEGMIQSLHGYQQAVERCLVLDSSGGCSLGRSQGSALS